ncbi:MAG: DUF4065 domain-containing protein [Clostridia bacterium]|nr:DUF4065 domain-containing protein [Clostridia bacterium]
MASARTVARVFEYLSHKYDEEPMENTRLNKLVYFAQGHMLGESGKELFKNEIDAWQFGPVVSVVYNDFSKIRQRAKTDDLSDIDLTPEQVELIMDVWNQYGGYTAHKLTLMTHMPGTPWSQTYVEGKKDVHIPKDVMLEYFSRPANRLKRTMDEASQTPADTVLPKDEYDPEEDAIWEAMLYDA